MDKIPPTPDPHSFTDAVDLAGDLIDDARLTQLAIGGLEAHCRASEPQPHHFEAVRLAAQRTLDTAMQRVLSNLLAKHAAASRCVAETQP